VRERVRKRGSEREQKEQSQDFERKKRAIDERLASDKLDSKRIASQRIQEFESRRFESSRVREFELDSGVIPTVKSERNKESEKLSG
jgi:hypothetical protein